MSIERRKSSRKNPRIVFDTSIKVLITILWKILGKSSAGETNSEAMEDNHCCVIIIPCSNRPG
jgi:hypothetical protein